MATSAVWSVKFQVLEFVKRARDDKDSNTEAREWVKKELNVVAEDGESAVAKAKASINKDTKFSLEYLACVWNVDII